jgi:uncharacterized protein DUF4019
MRVLHGARAGLVVALLALAAGAFAADTPQDAAHKAAESWLKLVDDGKYGDSWDAAAVIFKSAKTREQWVQAAASVRGHVGKLSSRKLKSREFGKTLPGAPTGQYVTLQYESGSEKKGFAAETLVATLDADGAWRAAEYFVQWVTLN